MKLRYRKEGKLTYKGKQYRKGNILRVRNLGNLPADWFEVIEEPKRVEKPERIEKPEKIEKTTKIKPKPKKEVINYGFGKSADKDLDG